MGTGRVGAVVIGGYANGLGVVRALAAAGVRAAVVTTKPYDIAQYSRAAAETCALPDLHEHPESLVELLASRAAVWRGAALYPTNDFALESLSRHRDELSRRYRVISEPWDVVEPILRKDRTYRLAQELGIDIPRVYGPACGAIAERPDIQYPVVVKPVESHVFVERFGQKLFVAADSAELAAHCRVVEGERIEALVVDLVPGRDDRIYCYSLYLDGRGRQIAGVAVRKLRQSPPFFGVARVAEVIDGSDVLREPALAMLRRIGYRGMADAQFKLDPRDGRLRLLELNARPVVYNGLVRRAGVNLPAIALADRVDGACAPVEPNGWRGVWIHLHADLLNGILHRRHERLPLADQLAPNGRAGTTSWLRSGLAVLLLLLRLGMIVRARFDPARSPYPRAVPAVHRCARSYAFALLSSRPYYLNATVFLACMFLLIGLYQAPWGIGLIRAQFVLIYLGSSVNKLFEPDWWSGQYFEHYLIHTVGSAPYAALAQALPPMSLSMAMCWMTIATEAALVPLLAVLRWQTRGVVLAAAFHTGSVVIAQQTFGSFFSTLLLSFAVFFHWPPAIVMEHLRAHPLHRAMRRVSTLVDADGRFRWEASAGCSGGLAARLEGRREVGVRAGAVWLLCSPAFCLTLAVVLAWADLADYFGRILGKVLG